MEGLVLGALQKHLMNPELCQIFCDEYTRHMNDLRIQQSGQRVSNETELKRRLREEDRLVQMILDGVASTHSLKDKINANSARIQELKDILVDKPEVPPLLHPNMGLHYRKEISKLMGLLDDPENRLEAIVLIRGLIEKIVLNPIEGTKELAVDLHGDLAGVLKMASNKDKPLIELETMADQVKLVAGVGFEPTTFRL